MSTRQFIGNVKGQKGDQGVSVVSVEQTVTSDVDGGINEITVTLSDGRKETFQVTNGRTGQKGDQGVSVKTVAQTTTANNDGGSNVITVTLTDGTQATFTVKNGNKGDKGDKGDTGDLSQECADARTSVTGRSYDDLKSRLDTEYHFLDTKASCIEGEASGDTITDSASASVIYLKNSGYTEQKTLSGKNKLPNNFISQTVNSVALTANEDKTISVSGTNSKDEAFSIKIVDSFTLPAGTYRLSGNPFIDGVTRMLVSTTGSDNYVDYGKDAVFTISEETQFSCSVVFKGATAFNGVIKPMIRLSTETDATYEPYCGGIASPNPDYPQRIGANGDKGYFDGQLLKGYLEADGRFIANTHDSTTNSVKCNGGDVVKVTYEDDATRISICAYNEDTFISRENITAVSEIEYTMPTNANNFKVCIHGVLPTDAKHISVTINGNYAIPVKTTGKNIFGGIKLAKALVDSGSTNVVLDESAGTVKYSYNTNYNVEGKNVLFNNFKENTQYTIILNGNHSNAGTSEVTYYTQFSINYTDGTSDTLLLSNTGNFTKLFVSNENKTILRIRYTWADRDYITLNYNQCGIFEGVITEEEFEPYQETTASIPITEPFYDGDYIEVYADGTGREYRKMGSVVFDGSSDETWAISTSADKTLHYIKVPSTKSRYTGEERCTHYQTSTTYWGSSDDKTCGFIVDSTAQFGIVDNDYTDNDSWKTWLQSNPVTVLYELAEPTSKPLTAEQVAEFMKLQTFKPVTHVNADGEYIIKYVVDTKTYIDKKFAELQSLINA